MQHPEKLNLAAGPVPQADDQGRQHVRVALAKTDAWFGRFGAWVILAFAFLYYAQYYRSSLNFAGEGGTVAVQALRLMEGQRPIVDTFLGYNVMWFYPVVWLFQLVGPNYIALRIYFFCICAAGAVLGFFILRRATGSGLYATAVATILVLIPGMLFRNYMPFLGLLNMFMLLQAYVFTPKTTAARLVWMALAGLVVGLTFLIRVDLGIFFTLLLIGSAVLYPLGVRSEFLARLPVAIGGLLLAIMMMGAIHLPVYFDAKARGFGPSFVAQYTDWIGFVRSEMKNQLKAPPPASGSGKIMKAVTKEETAEESESDTGTERNGLRRLPLAGVIQLPALADKIYVLLTYLPILLSVVIVATAGVFFLTAVIRCDAAMREATLAILTSIGCALTLFPQFFFFRPDVPHLSEFMAPFLVALGCAGWWGGRLARGAGPMALRVGAVLLVLICAANAAFYISLAMPNESAGTIAAARKRCQEFTAQNGVRVRLKSKEQQEDKSIYDTIMKYSGPQDYVVCYPYAPTINFMTDRRSYEYNLYVDNATAPHKFQQEFLAKLAKYQPAVILIDNRDINKSNSSRFAVWAAPSYDFVRQHYKLAGTFHRQEIYVRPDRFLSATTPPQ